MIKIYVFPLLGIMFSFIGFTLLKLISEIEEEALSLRQDLIQLRKLVENNLSEKR